MRALALCHHSHHSCLCAHPVCTAIAPLQVQRGGQAQQLAHVRLAHVHACVRICLRVCANCYPVVTRARDHLFEPKVHFFFTTTIVFVGTAAPSSASSPAGVQAMALFCAAKRFRCAPSVIYGGHASGAPAQRAAVETAICRGTETRDGRPVCCTGAIRVRPVIDK